VGQYCCFYIVSVQVGLVLALSAAEVVWTALMLMLEKEEEVAVMLGRVAVVDESCWAWVMFLAVLGVVQRVNAREGCVEKPR
jgi:divalent metal cation (Fe/Co/Zn/Cd) transporter